MATQIAPQVSVRARPTRVRHKVIVFAVTLGVITYIDRVCISQAAPFMTEDLGLTKAQMGWVFAAFAWSYALFEIPGGYLGDWIGPRKVLMRIVVWWSFFTAATGWVWNYISLLVTRFMFGAGEAGCFPNLTKAFTTWLPPSERVRAQGIMWMSARWGGAFTPVLVFWVLQFVSWRRAFEIFGALGILWAIWFYWWYRDNPRDDRKINEAELALLEGSERLASGHGDVPWGKLIRSKQAWLLCLQYFCLAYGWYFYITWLPTYLKEGRGQNLAQGAVLSILPLFCGLISTPIARWTGSVAFTRRLMAIIGFSGATGLLILSTFVKDPVWAMIAMGMASFSNDLVMPGSWAACMDVGGKYAGTLSGAMNMMGNFAGGMSPVVIGYVLQQTDNNWDITFYVSAALYFAGSFFWLILDPVTPFDESAKAH
jgi:MFS transporter, ACS family, glucarate transporter